MKSDMENKDFHVLRLLEQSPELSQREIAGHLKISLGSVNYCLRALTEKGLVKVKNFRRSDNRLAYAYLLTPKGLQEKAAITRRFLVRKQKEYEKIQHEIASLQNELAGEKSDFQPSGQFPDDDD